MSLPPSRPVRLGEPLDLARPTTNPAAITRPPVLGNIDQIAIPQQGGASTISPTVYTRDLNVPGTNIGVETPRRMPGDVGDQFYRPVAGDPLGEPFSRNGRPLRNAGIGEPLNSNRATPTPRRGPAPVNSPSPGATVSAPRTANPGRAVNLRTFLDFDIPRPSPSTLARGAADLGVSFAGEALIDSFWDRVSPNREQRYQERTQDPRRSRPTSRGLSLGIGALGQGGVGLAGLGAVAATRYLLPDDVDPGNPRGVIGRLLNWDEDYPNQLDPAAMGQGPVTTEGQIESGGTGQTPGATYGGVGSLRMYYVSTGATATRFDTGIYFGPNPVYPVGPVSAPVRVMSGNSVSYQFTAANGVYFVNLGGVPWRDVTTFNYELESWAFQRNDGGTDPPYQPEQPPTYAPNPARTAPQGNPDRPWESPANLPAPPMPYRPLPTEDAPQIWPFAEPLDLGGPRLQPEPDLPPTFEPSPNLANIPSAEPAPDPIPAGRPDLSPDAAPGSNPGADLATDPDTPPVLDGLAPVNQGSEQLSGWIYNGRRMPANQPFTIGNPRLTGDSGWMREDGTPLTEEEIEAVEARLPYVSGLNPSAIPTPVRVPVMIPVGGRQTVTTPAWNLTNDPSQRPNPFTQQQTPRVVQSSSSPPKGVCRYEQQRVADIQRKATTTEEMSSNPLSGFLGLYGLGIEARTKLGQTYENTQQTKERIRPEDFPMLLPAQIADPNTAQVTINSLGELGVWIVKQLDGVAGKWPMEVPVPGASSALAVPNMSEAIAEMFGMMISQQVTAAQILNTSSRTLAQAGSATQQAALANMIAKGNAEFLGYEAKPTAVDMPLTYTPGHDPGEGLLEESTAKIKGWENTDGTDLKQILSDVLHACQIIKAVYWRRLDAKGDFQAQIDQQIRGKSQWLDELGQRPTAQQAEDWEQYLRDVEQGFTTRTNDATPYGRNPTEGPQVRDVTPEPPTTP